MYKISLLIKKFHAWAVARDQRGDALDAQTINAWADWPTHHPGDRR